MADEKAQSFTELLREVRSSIPELEEYTTDRAEVQGTVFHFLPMPALAAWKLGEKVRVECSALIARIFDRLSTDKKLASETLFALVSAMPEPLVDFLMKSVTRHIHFEVPPQGDRQPLEKGGWDVAFRAKHPAEKVMGMYEVLFRALARNLIPPLRVSDTSS